MHPLILTLALFCSDPNGYEMFATVDVQNSREYDVKLRDTWAELPVHQKEIRLNDQGEIVRVSTSALWESFTVTKSEDSWTGVYWNDNVHYDLTCKEIP